MSDDALRGRAERAANDGSLDILDAERSGVSLPGLYRRALATLRDDGLSLDDRLRAFWTLRLLEFRGVTKPIVDIEPDFDPLDYLHAAVEAGAGGTLAAEHGAALAAALRAARFDRRGRFA